MSLRLVPQEAFKAQRRYDVQRSIIFTTRGVVGVHVRTACEGSLDYLDMPEVRPTTSTTSDRITLRILWPGYPVWSFVNMSISDHSFRNTTFTTKQLVQALAKHIRRFYEEMTSPGTPPGRDPVWALENIDFNRLYLTELQHVSQGSWQPVLFYQEF